MPGRLPRMSVVLPCGALVMAMSLAGALAAPSGGTSNRVSPQAGTDSTEARLWVNDGGGELYDGSGRRDPFSSTGCGSCLPCKGIACVKVSEAKLVAVVSTSRTGQRLAMFVGPDNTGYPMKEGDSFADGILIRIDIAKEHVPAKARYLVLKYIRMGIIDIDHIVNVDMLILANLVLRARRLQKEIGELQEASSRRKQAAAEAWLKS